MDLNTICTPVTYKHTYTHIHTHTHTHTYIYIYICVLKHFASHQPKTVGHHINIHYFKKYYFNKSCIFPTDLTLHTISKLHNEWDQCCSHLRNSHGRCVGTLRTEGVASKGVMFVPSSAKFNKLDSLISVNLI
jgi:hypothetical protein